MIPQDVTIRLEVETRNVRFALARFRTQFALLSAAAFVASIEADRREDAARALLGPRLSRYDLSYG